MREVFQPHWYPRLEASTLPFPKPPGKTRQTGHTEPINFRARPSPILSQGHCPHWGPRGRGGLAWLEEASLGPGRETCQACRA